MEYKDLNINKEDSLLFNFINGNTSVKETNDVIERIKDDEAFRKKYLEIKNRIESYDSKYISDQINVNKAIDRFKERIDKETKNNKIVIPNILKIAAGILIIVSVSIFLWPVKTITLSAVNNKIENFTLPDGSVIWLNKNSTLEYPKRFKGNIRDINLIGEAYFKVKSIKGKNFNVITNDVIIKVTGTEFNVIAYPELKNVSILVNEGEVEAYTKEDIKISDIKTEEISIINREDLSVRKEKNVNQNLDSWKTGVFDFDETKLIDAIQVLNNYYNVNIVLNNSKLENYELTSTFTNESLESVLEILAHIYGLKIENSDSIVYISAIN